MVAYHLKLFMFMLINRVPGISSGKQVDIVGQKSLDHKLNLREILANVPRSGSFRVRRGFSEISIAEKLNLLLSIVPENRIIFKKIFFFINSTYKSS